MLTKPFVRLIRRLCLPVALSLLIAAAAVPQEPAAESGVLHGHVAPVLMGVFTPDGTRALTVSSDETAKLWDVGNTKEIRTYSGHTGPLYCLALSGNGRTLATGAQDNTLRLWDVPQPKPIVALAGHQGAAQGLAVSPDGRLFLSGGADKAVRLWDAVKVLSNDDPAKLTIDMVSAPRSGHSDPITVAAYRNDGNLMATADAVGRIFLWSPYLDASQGELGLHEGGVTGLAFHANNQLLVSSGADGLVRIWQLPPPPPRQIEAFKLAVKDVAVLNNQAVSLVATTDNVVRAVDLNTGQTVREFPKNEASVTAIAVTPNNALLGVADAGGKLRLFNVADAAPRGELTGHAGAIRDVVFHPDNQTVSTAAADGTVRMSKLPNPDAAQPAEELLVRSWAGLEKEAKALAVSPDGARLFAGSGSGKIQQWRTNDGELERTLAGHTDAVTELTVSPNGQQLLSTSRDKTVKQWNLADGAVLHTMSHPAVVHSVSISNDGGRIVTAAEGGFVRVWDATVGVALETLSGHAAGVCLARWLSDNQTLISGSADNSLRVWQTSIVRSFGPHAKPILDMALYNGGAQIVTCAAEGPVVMSDSGNGQPVRQFDGLAGEIRAVACRADNQRIAAGTSEGKVGIWNAGDAQLLQTLSVTGAVTSLAWSADNQKLAVSTDQKALVVFGPPLPPQSPQPGNELVEHQQTTAEAAIGRLVFDRDNRNLWAAHADGHIARWAYASPVQTRQFNHGGPVYGVAISRDGNTVVSCSADQTVRIWDATTGQQRAAMSGHQGAIHAVALTPDESLIVSSGADRTLRLWDVAGGRQLKQLATLSETMYSVAVHPNGQLVAAGGADRKVHLFNLLTGEEVRTLEGHTDFIHSVAFNGDGTKLLSYGYAGQLRAWNTADGKPLFDQRVGRIGNFASYAPDGANVLLSNGDATARVFELPAEAR